MKKSYHVCFTSHQEVMFRNEEDYGMFLNLMALRGFATGSEWLMDAEMSTHVHLNAFTDCPTFLAGTLRMSYTKWFNHRHGRKGRMGEKGFYLLEVNGFNHQMVLQNYIGRNGLHHGAAPTAFGYRHCSTRELFAGEIGFEPKVAGHFSKEEMARILPQHSTFPDKYEMDERGVFLRRSFMELRRAEQYYGTSRNYLYQMNRLSGDNWKAEQDTDNSGPPITLALVEQADENTVAQMLKNEFGRSFRADRMQDLDVCRLIDTQLLRGVSSVYQIPPSRKRRIYHILREELHLPVPQICRCLVCEPF